MATWKFNLAGETLSGAQRLKIGKFPYLIKSFKPEVDKQDPTGKKQRVVLDLQHGEDYNCKVYLNVMDDNETVANIADKTIRTIVQAAGVKQLAATVGKYVVITATEKAGTGKNADKTYVNILTAEPYDEDAVEEEEETPAPKSSKKAKEPEPDDEDESEDEDEDPEEETEPTPAPTKKSRPW